MTNLIEASEKLEKDFFMEQEKVATRPEPDTVESMRVNWLGRKGHVTKLFDELRNAPKDERPAAGKALNILRGKIEKSIEGLKEAAIEFSIEQQLSGSGIDITLPSGAMDHKGSLHPVTLIRERILKEFRHLGFTVYDGPEVDYDFYNFSSLNFPDNHPAREMQDTFFLENGNKMLMRTHTSNIQIHCMLNEEPPLRVVAPGRTFRCDSDPTHTPMFHQIEGFIVDKGISFAHMKGTMDNFLKALFGNDLKTRFRPSFFPFVEPGAEMDIQCTICRGEGCRVCSHTGWLEIGGCGMIHPNVFEAVHYDSEEYTGFAFGFGLDRMAMMAYSLTDLRQLFEGDKEFQKQFPVYS